MRLVLLLAIVLCRFGAGAMLPGALSVPQINDITKTLGMGSATRLLRAADAYPSYPGFKIGAEVLLLSPGHLGQLGNQTGAVTNLLPVPRFVLAKGLFSDLELVFSFLPFSLGTVSTVGGALKWTFAPESEQWLAMAAWVGFTSATAYDGEFRGQTLEVGMVISKDYVRIKPFLGAAVMGARGNVAPGLALGPNESQTLLGTHVFAGFEIEMPVQLTIQIEAVNTDPAASFFIGKHF